MTQRPGNIYLCGMIGSGKTTVGSHLARELEVLFLQRFIATSGDNGHER